jgi:trk system potassium uptake protein TrkA
MQIIIIGCGKVGSALASALVSQDHDVVIIESDTRLIQNADDLDCIKITGVPIDRDVLKQAGIETADVLCAVTQNDNINIMVAQIASGIFNVPRIITRIFNPASREVFEEFDLNTICSTELTVQAFLRKISGEVQISDQQVINNSIVYTSVPIEKNLVGEDITNLSTDTGKLVFGLLRDSRLLLAAPGLRIQAGDALVLAGLQV